MKDLKTYCLHCNRIRCCAVLLMSVLCVCCVAVNLVLNDSNKNHDDNDNDDADFGLTPDSSRSLHHHSPLTTSAEKYITSHIHTKYIKFYIESI